MAIKRRSTYFIYPNAEELGVFDNIKQTKTQVLIPASDRIPLTIEEKVQVDFSSINKDYLSILKNVGLFNLRLTPSKTDKSVLPQNSFKNTIFNDYDSLNCGTSGLIIDVAPRQAKTLAQYESMSKLLIELLLKMVNIEYIESNKLPIFYHNEWFRFHDFTELKQPHTLSILSLWNSFVDGGAETIPLLTSMPDLKKLDSFELILDESTTSLNFLFYWKQVTEPIIVAKQQKMKLKPRDKMIHELGIFHLESLDRNDYDSCISGLRLSVEPQSEINLTPTLLYLNPLHNTLNSYLSKHVIMEPTGFHPSYKVEMLENENIENNKMYGFKPDENCKLMFNLDISEDIVIDKYQLKNIKDTFLNFSISNSMDLELPSYKIPDCGSQVLFELNDTLAIQKKGFEVPLHLRYGEPKLHDDYTLVNMPMGNLYWECPIGNTEREMMTSSLFYENRLNFEKFNEGIKLYHFANLNGTGNNLKLKLPVGDLNDDKTVELVTLIVLILSTLWITKRLFF